MRRKSKHFFNSRSTIWWTCKKKWWTYQNRWRTPFIKPISSFFQYFSDAIFTDTPEKYPLSSPTQQLIAKPQLPATVWIFPKRQPKILYSFLHNILYTWQCVGLSIVLAFICHDICPRFQKSIKKNGYGYKNKTSRSAYGVFKKDPV